MVLFMGFGCVLVHFASRFAAFYLAFWCISHCVLVHIAVRFAAFRSAFCRISQCVLLHFAVRFAAKCAATSSY